MRDLNRYYEICKKELDAIGIPYGKILEVKVNTRAKERWGQCKHVPGGYSININVRLLDEQNSEAGLKDTIIHEMLHTCEGCMNHGDKWKLWARKVNNYYGYNIKRCSSAAEKGVREDETETEPQEDRYVVTCEKCKHAWARQRMCKLVEQTYRYSCPYCGGRLIRIK